MVDALGRSHVLTRDDRLGTVQRDLVAALRDGSAITHMVVDLAAPQLNRTAMLVSFTDRASAARAVEAVTALARPVALDLLDETAMLLVAGFGGIDIYPQGTALFVEIADQDQAVVDRDVRTVEDVCFEQGATAVRESSAHHIAEADDALATACRPVHHALGYVPVHDGPVPMSELAAFVLRCDEIQRRVGLHLTVFVDGSTGVVTCWPPLGTDARLAELVRVALSTYR
jgi:glycolate oxidase